MSRTPLKRLRFGIDHAATAEGEASSASGTGLEGEPASGYDKKGGLGGRPCPT